MCKIKQYGSEQKIKWVGSDRVKSACLCYNQHCTILTLLVTITSNVAFMVQIAIRVLQLVMSIITKQKYTQGHNWHNCLSSTDLTVKL